MKHILNTLHQHEVIQNFSLGKGSFSHVSLTQEALLIAASFTHHKRTLFIIKKNLFQAQKLYEKLQYWLQDEVLLLPVEDSLRVESIASSPEIHVMRMESLTRLLNNDLCVVVTHVGAAVRYFPQPTYLRQHQIHLTQGQQMDPLQLSRQLMQLGYKETIKVDQPSTFARRGGIIDVFPIHLDTPVRIEFFDTEVESLRCFDVVSQRTQQPLNDLSILLASDLIFSDQEITELKATLHQHLERYQNQHNLNAYLELKEHIDRDLALIEAHLHEGHLYRYRALLNQAASLFDYAPASQVILSNTEDIEEQILHLTQETLEYIVELSEAHKALPRFEVFHDLYSALSGHKRIDFHRFETKSNSPRLPFRELDIPQEDLLIHTKRIGLEAQDKLIILCLSENEIKQVIPYLVDLKIPYAMRRKDNQNKGVVILNHLIDEGYELLEDKVIVYGSKELFNQRIQLSRYNAKFKEAESLQSYQELQSGDYVVHYQYGVGQYLGITTKEVMGIHRDYLNIVYRNNSKLFVPLEQFHLVRKFVSREGVVPRLHSLGSNEWKKTKARIKENVRDIAERLIELYREREKDIAYAFKQDDDLQVDFEKSFPYTLTPDQVRAVDEVKQDMMQPKPMDRLLCGDVGFGKTEVALRAAFKAVSEHKQVAFLCPTTVLSQQHFRTFVNRLKSFAVEVAVLNRFVTPAQQRIILERVKKGDIDILIGTHRILSKDVEFKDLGLLVIDEEQRFGVEHKEQIKEVRQSVHVLSLSATPIPRTLQMSLVGVRQLSQLQTPPLNRHPVLTYVIEKNEAVIKEVIQRELARDGQVFYLFNNIDHIHSVAFAISKMVPQAKVAVAHGQMDRSDIEDVMVSFNNNEIQVLVCTTIVETGIDIPNANTILIDQADTFGLSQLYQIKGRVGRSDRIAYAYLMYHPRKQLSEIAQKRLQSIKEFTELGSGYKIAMRDLTIRGAGELLGDLQSGFIDTVGIDMYIEMLQDAIEEKRTGIIKEDLEPEAKLTLHVDGYIPQTFEQQDFEKLSLYQRIDQAKSIGQLRELQEEVMDRYGRLPKSVELLFEKKHWELLTQLGFVEGYKELNNELSITFTQDWSSRVDGVAFFTKMSNISANIRLKYTSGHIVLLLQKEEDWLFTATRLLEQTQSIQLKGDPHAH
jgi:transcription-repair coupling factor (superfamily II helicase)